MKSIVSAIICLSLAATSFAAGTNEPAIIPLPQQLQRLDGEFKLSRATQIISDQDSSQTAGYLVERLRKSTGYPFRALVNTRQVANTRNVIVLTTNGADAGLGAEGYELEVAKNSIVIRAPAPAGLFYGAQTLLQLLPPEIFSSNLVANVNWQAPCVRIRDWPRFPWRGLMLDVSRHFYTKTEVERILDDMALFKLNTFHWHLTDDQGWRIEIKKYPKLTEIGAWRTHSELASPGHQGEAVVNAKTHPAWAAVAPAAFGPDGRYGGFYTQDDIREVVAYAAARHITIVPEIETPGHCVAALAAYPQFSCFDGAYSTDVAAGVNSGVYCAGKDATFAFLEDVLTEVFQLFPGKFVHIGGDEVNAQVKKETWGKCPLCQERMRTNGLKNEDELQSYFIHRIETFVSAHDKRLIGWSEILQGGLPQNAAVMDWIGGAVEAAGAGHDVVMTPTAFCYLDHYQSTNHAAEPRAIGGYLPLQQVYAFEPVPAKLAPEFQSHILGGQCNLWTEYIASLPHAEYMIFPRECALAEVTWSSRESRDFDDFVRRLQTSDLRLDQLGINHRQTSIETLK